MLYHGQVSSGTHSLSLSLVRVELERSSGSRSTSNVASIGLRSFKKDRVILAARALERDIDLTRTAAPRRETKVGVEVARRGADRI